MSRSLPVLAVPQQGMAGGGELGADLMGAAGDQLALHQGQAVPDGQGAVEGDGGLGPWNGLGADIDLLFYLVLPEIALQLSLPLGMVPWITQR